MAVDLFETRAMLEALSQSIAPKTFLRDFIFTGQKTFNTKTVDIDIRKGKQRIAPYVNPRMPGKMVERIGYTTNTYAPPYVKPKMITTAEDYLTRDIGRSIYEGNLTAGQRAARKLGEDLGELNAIITRREEQQCSDVLNDGIITVVGEGVNDAIDFQMAATHKITLTGLALWTDTTNSTPFVNLRTWDRLNAQDSGISSEFAIMGSSVYDAFVAHPEYEKRVNFRRSDSVAFETRDLDSGAKYRGRYDEAGLDIYTYDAQYIDDAGATQPMIAVDKVIMGSTRARAEKLYGMIQDIEAMVEAPRFAKSWIEKDPSSRILLLQSAPLMSLHQVDAFVSAKAV